MVSSVQWGKDIHTYLSICKIYIISEFNYLLVLKCSTRFLSASPFAPYVHWHFQLITMTFTISSWIGSSEKLQWTESPHHFSVLNCVKYSALSCLTGALKRLNILWLGYPFIYFFSFLFIFRFFFFHKNNPHPLEHVWNGMKLRTNLHS